MLIVRQLCSPFLVSLMRYYFTTTTHASRVRVAPLDKSPSLHLSNQMQPMYLGSFHSNVSHSLLEPIAQLKDLYHWSLRFLRLEQVVSSGHSILRTSVAKKINDNLISDTLATFGSYFAEKGKIAPPCSFGISLFVPTRKHLFLRPRDKSLTDQDGRIPAAFHCFFLTSYSY